MAPTDTNSGAPAPENTPKPSAPAAPAEPAKFKADEFGIIVDHNFDDPNYKEFVAPHRNEGKDNA